MTSRGPWGWSNLRAVHTEMSDIYDLGDEPRLGEVPKRMHAFAVRQNRFGQPRDAWKREILPTPSIGPDEVLIYVMASGINFNNVWAALGAPLDVIAERQKQGEPEDFHAGGSDCSGIVWATGSAVTNVAVGDHVIVHSGWWRSDDPWVLSGKDPMLAASTRIWGYQTNYGSYCQFARAQAHQCLPKPEHLTWEEAGCFLLCASTAYRMLRGWSGHTVQSGDVVLVWGAAGGLGSMALGITRAFNGRARRRRVRRRQACLLPRARRGGRYQSSHLHPLGADAQHEGRTGRTASG